MVTADSVREFRRAMAQIVDSGLSLGELERAVRFEAVNAALARHKGNQVQAARALRVHRNTLGRAMEEMRHVDALREGRPRKYVATAVKRPPRRYAPTLLDRETGWRA